MAKILFFNGWGMNEKALPQLNDQVVVLNYPYTLPPELDLHTEPWVAIGWSFGAYYLAKFIQHHPEVKFQAVIAINGHGNMLGKAGINPKMLQLTISTLTKESLQSFYANMALPQDKGNDAKTIPALIAELEDFQTNFQDRGNPFTLAYISNKDRIVPTKAMVKYFQAHGTPIINLAGPHYPFEELNSWEKILEGGELS